MQDKARQRKIANEMLEYSQEPHRSRYFLVSKILWNIDSSTMYSHSTDSLFMMPVCLPHSMSFQRTSQCIQFLHLSTITPVTTGSCLLHNHGILPRFLTDADLGRQTRLPKGRTNSVAVFQRIIHWNQVSMKRPIMMQ